MKKSPYVFIICGVFNRLVLTKRFLSCIKNQSYPKIRTIIIDDGSTDGTREYIKHNYPHITYISGDGNLWWTGSIRKGVQEVLHNTKNDDYILIINNDCIFGKSYLKTLVSRSTQNGRAIVGSAIYDVNNKKKLIDAGVRVDWWRGKFRSRVLNTTMIDALTTKGTIYPIEVFRTIGNFDAKHFPHYLSDYEFSIRAKKNGFKLLVSTSAMLFNEINQTGIGELVPQKMTFSESVSMLLSKKSKRNVYDHFWFITLCCPWYYKSLNYSLLFLRSLYIVTKGLSMR